MSRRSRGERGWARVGSVSLLALLVGASAPWGAGAAEEGAAGGLERLRQAIEEARERVGGHEREERGLLERLEQIDRELERLRVEAAGARESAARARAKSVGLEPLLARLKQRRERTRRVMARRAVALYRAGEAGPLRVLFSSASLPDLLSRVAGLRRLLQSDAALVARATAELKELGAVEREAAQAEEALARALARFEERSGELAASRRTKSELLARVSRDRARERALLVELERASRALEMTLSSLEGEQGGESSAAAAVGPGFARLRGRLPWPVDATIREHFGRVVDSEYQTTVFRKGVELAAEAGRAVRAVASGRVRFAGWFRGYGKIVILDHGDGYFTVNGHLAEIRVRIGQRVEAGSELGTVGETGSLSGPGFYFEVRRGSESENPERWLRPRAAR